MTLPPIVGEILGFTFCAIDHASPLSASEHITHILILNQQDVMKKQMFELKCFVQNVYIQNAYPVSFQVSG